MKNTASTQEFVSQETYDKALQEISFLKHQVEEMRRLIFGAKSERYIPQDNLDGQQLDLFEAPSSQEKSPQPEEVTYTRRKPVKEKAHPIRAEIAEHLPRIEYGD